MDERMDCDGGEEDCLPELLWDEEGGKEIGKHTLIGKLLTKKQMNRATVGSMIRKGWNLAIEVEINEIPFLEVNLDFSPYWCQFHGLPLEGLNRRNVEILGNILGKVLAFENPVPRPNGSRIWITIKYEKLQNFCFSCGQLGHDVRGCKKPRVKENNGKFSAWLGTVPIRGGKDVVQLIREDNEDGEVEVYNQNIDVDMDMGQKEDVREINNLPDKEEAFDKKENVVLSADAIRKTEEKVEWKIKREGKGKGVERDKGGCVESGPNSNSKLIVRKERREVVDEGGKEIITNKLGYFVEFPKDDYIGEMVEIGNEKVDKEDECMEESLEVKELIEKHELMPQLRNVAIKRPGDEDNIATSSKKLKVEKFLVGCLGEMEVQVEEKKKKQGMRSSKKSVKMDVVSDLNLHDVPVREGIWEMDDKGKGVFKFTAGSDNEVGNIMVVAEGFSGCPLTTTKGQ
ncbi:Ribosomal protein S21 [Senna tora]|uniref:Ribosomal protein S21 n=1 Tax=Senna tora TaxID=362788 RepID=A0A835CGL0_9FABA|nr:Ribosomal protein S21 [Senna tora]